MASAGTIRHTSLLSVGGALALLGLAACGSSHGPGGSDGSVGDGGDCGPIVGSCMDECCNSAGAPSFDAECNPICPGDTSLIDRCAPAPSCGDGGMGCGAIDPGFCYAGPCCSDRVSAELDYDTCSTYCPEGYSRECTPDPDVRCAAPWLSCELNADCRLAIDSCCGPCGVPSLDDFDAINGDYSDEHRESVCDDPEPVCPACATAPNPSLGATCDSGMCQGFDVRAMDLSACESDDDCRLRVTECCECGGDTSRGSLIALRTDAEADYQSLVCDEVACPECEPIYPTDVEAYCADDGHCDVRTVTDGG